MVKPTGKMHVDPEDLRIAKGIASFKGMSLNKYFGSLIDEEGKRFQQEINQDVYRRSKQR